MYLAIKLIRFSRAWGVTTLMKAQDAFHVTKIFSSNQLKCKWNVRIKWTTWLKWKFCANRTVISCQSARIKCNTCPSPPSSLLPCHECEQMHWSTHLSQSAGNCWGVTNHYLGVMTPESSFGQGWQVSSLFVHPCYGSEKTVLSLGGSLYTFDWNFLPPILGNLTEIFTSLSDLHLLSHTRIEQLIIPYKSVSDPFVLHLKSPQQVFVAVNEPLDIDCLIKGPNHDLHSSQLLWKHNNTWIPNASHVIDNRTVQLRIGHVHFNNSGVYGCGLFSNSSQFQNVTVQNVTVVVGGMHLLHVHIA